jgi:hypothetical protein
VTEAQFSRELQKRLNDALRGTPHVVIKHNDALPGVPDTSVTYNRRTLWLESKKADPSFVFGGLQQLTCLRLAAAGLCRIVIFDVHLDAVIIIEPQQIDQWRTGGVRFSPINVQWAAEKLVKLMESC